MALPSRALPRLPYLKRYGLVDDPFAPVASQRYAYGTQAHIEAVNKMLQVVSGRAALGICSGDVGLGKTTLARSLADELLAHGIPTIYLPEVPGGPRQSDAAIMRTVVNEFRLKTAPGRATGGLYATIGAFARDNYDNDNNTVILIDEAHRLKASGIRAILQLLALQTQEAQLVQVILFGQNPELIQSVTGNPALHTRTSANVELTTFSEEEVKAMLEFRLKVAQRTKPLFTPEAIHSITVASKGIPRTICRIAREACLLAAEADADAVDVEHIQRSASSLHHDGQ
jgi:type II secretory pathway predicted ATPase ExeA